MALIKFLIAKHSVGYLGFRAHIALSEKQHLPTVQVPADHDVHLGVHGWEESPIHRKHVTSV